MKQDKYSEMQKRFYDSDASNWSITNRDPVVGSFDYHNNWADYDNFLFKDINTQDKIALEFGCGPGRNIVKFNNRFKRIDGVDISQINLDKAREWCKHNNIPNDFNLIVNNGKDISCIESNTYDVVFSTICFQHICVYNTRFSLLTDFYRVLKNGGNLCMQMGYGFEPNKNTSAYEENYYDAISTNGYYDVRVENPDQIKNDLEKIGFSNFSFDIRPVGPGDNHPNWIFFRASKII
jgi:ubiquinone/menaquinone biosynthesis C-methylase UbiE